MCDVSLRFLPRSPVLALALVVVGCGQPPQTPPVAPDASTTAPLRFAYTVLYVPDVEKALDFYQRAFGFERRYVHRSIEYAQLETGSTLLGFAEHELVEALELPFRPTVPDESPPGFEIGLTTTDVDGAFERAVAAGATVIHPPRATPWGQRVAHVRDLNGVIVVLGSP